MKIFECPNCGSINEYPEKSNKPRVLECQKCGAPPPLDAIKDRAEGGYVNASIVGFPVVCGRRVPITSDGRVRLMDGTTSTIENLAISFKGLSGSMERAAFLVKQFGRNGLDMAEVLEDGAKRFKDNPLLYSFGDVGRQMAESLDAEIMSSVDPFNSEAWEYKG